MSTCVGMITWVRAGIARWQSHGYEYCGRTMFALIPAKAGIHCNVEKRILDTHFRGYESLGDNWANTRFAPD